MGNMPRRDKNTAITQLTATGWELLTHHKKKQGIKFITHYSAHNPKYKQTDGKIPVLQHTSFEGLLILVAQFKAKIELAESIL